MKTSDAGELPIKCFPCAHEDCPLLALMASPGAPPGNPPSVCVFHGTKRINAIDVFFPMSRIPGLERITVNDIIRGMLERKRMAIDWFAIRKLDPTAELEVGEVRPLATKLEREDAPSMAGVVYRFRIRGRMNSIMDADLGTSLEKALRTFLAAHRRTL
jgi:hypothetical protein